MYGIDAEERSASNTAFVAAVAVACPHGASLPLSPIHHYYLSAFFESRSRLCDHENASARNQLLLPHIHPTADYRTPRQNSKDSSQTIDKEPSCRCTDSYILCQCACNLPERSPLTSATRLSRCFFFDTPIILTYIWYVRQQFVKHRLTCRLVLTPVVDATLGQYCGLRHVDSVPLFVRSSRDRSRISSMGICAPCPFHRQGNGVFCLLSSN